MSAAQKELRAAVIGLGGMGRRHVAALDQLGLPVAALCDMNLAAARPRARWRRRAPHLPEGLAPAWR